MFTNILSHLYFELFYFFSVLSYIDGSLLSRVKNPVEHVSGTTISYILPKNVYRYEPYRGHRTLWKPTSTTKSEPESALPSQTKPSTKKRQQHEEHSSRHPIYVPTKKSYWHNFYDHEEAWPQVVLALSSTKTTTTQKKIKKTFASLFPPLNITIQKKSVDLNDSDEDEDDEQILNNNDVGMNWIPLNFETTGDSAHLEQEDNIETDEFGDNPQSTLRTYTVLMSDFDYFIHTIPTSREVVNKKSIFMTPGILREKHNSSSTTTTSNTTTISTTTATTKRTTTQPPSVHCYQCGLNVTEIPNVPTCYHIFEHPDRKYYHLRKKYMVFCEIKKSIKRKGTPKFDPSPDKFFKGGCFKRYLDIGAEVYNERGCRTMNPLRGKSFASSRFSALEKSMHYMTEGCVSSPHASLTPFSRAITLYARYHVCVCVGDYCNQSGALCPNYIYSLFLASSLRIFM
ncbi:uncharacterized protein LOC135118011 [Helicoverpa armigera]|uniref:uncharacterized protein LOC135118011 n=1 Tax=Helicoverpa armigera TaxID=29058 RepID=UPI0030838C62